jgi:branched-chain amino acid transport system substrate-binding protein
MDTETTPATGSRVAERLITRNEAAFLIGAVHSGGSKTLPRSREFARTSLSDTESLSA